MPFRRLAVAVLLMFVAIPVTSAQDPFQGLDLTSDAFTKSEMTREEVLAVVAKGTPETPADLSGKSLNGIDLSGADLHGVIFRAARLNKANLKGANLSGAALDAVWAMDAEFADATFASASIIGAQFIRAKDGRG